jgi:hypothetical protein
LKKSTTTTQTNQQPSHNPPHTHAKKHNHIKQKNNHPSQQNSTPLPQKHTTTLKKSNTAV